MKAIKNLILKRIKSYALLKIPDIAILKDFLFNLRPIRTENLIRVGSNNDGGYLIPNYLEGISDCFSPGVHNNVSFELYLAEKGIKCHMADASISQLPLNHDNFSFVRKFIGSKKDENYISFEDWVTNCNPDENSDWLLQMDIEGDEYDNLINMSSELLKKFRIMVIEYHDFHKNLDNDYLFFTKLIFNKLLISHSIVHLHINNCLSNKSFQGIELPQLLEITFLRNDYVDNSDYLTHEDLPSELDQPCVSNHAESAFPNWF